MARYRFGVDELVSEIRLGDFANAALPVGSGRAGKGRSGGRDLLLARERKDWWELSDAELAEQVPVDEEDAEEDEEDLTPTKTSGRSTRGARRRRRRLAESKRLPSDHWPRDLWHCLASYISPPDIGRFAGISRVTLDIVRGVSFWKDLYKRHYSSSVKLPQGLKAETVSSRLFGLRTRVIQLLFYTYPPFQQRVRYYPATLAFSALKWEPKVSTCAGIALRQSSLAKLALARLHSFWCSDPHSHSPHSRTFFFKLLLRYHKPQPVPKAGSASRDIVSRLEYLDDIAYNPEHGFVVLKVECKSFAEVSTKLMGWILCEVSFPLAADLSSHRVRLTFQSMAGWEVVNGTSRPMGQTGQVTLQGVTSIALLDWWHPLYPSAPF